MRSSKTNKLNMRNWVESMNRLNEKDHLPLIKVMEGITGTSYSGIRKQDAAEPPTMGDVFEISTEGINPVN